MKNLHLLPLFLLLLPLFSFAEKTPEQKIYDETCKPMGGTAISLSSDVIFTEKLTGRLLDCVKNKVGSQCLQNSLETRRGLGLANEYPYFIYADFEFCKGSLRFVAADGKRKAHAELVNQTGR